MAIMEGLAAAGQALDIIRKLRGIEKDYDAATFKMQMADLMTNVADARMALTEAREILEAREREIETLRASFADRGNLVRANGDYKYFANREGKPCGYPICPRCEQVDGRLVQLVQNGPIARAKCPVCSTEYLSMSGYTTLRDDMPAADGASALEVREAAPASAGRRIMAPNGPNGWMGS